MNVPSLRLRSISGSRIACGGRDFNSQRSTSRYDKVSWRTSLHSSGLLVTSLPINAQWPFPWLSGLVYKTIAATGTARRARLIDVRLNTSAYGQSPPRSYRPQIYPPRRTAFVKAPRRRSQAPLQNSIPAAHPLHCSRLNPTVTYAEVTGTRDGPEVLPRL